MGKNIKHKLTEQTLNVQLGPFEKKRNGNKRKKSKCSIEKKNTLKYDGMCQKKLKSFSFLKQNLFISHNNCYCAAIYLVDIKVHIPQQQQCFMSMWTRKTCLFMMREERVQNIHTLVIRYDLGAK